MTALRWSKHQPPIRPSGVVVVWDGPGRGGRVIVDVRMRHGQHAGIDAASGLRSCATGRSDDGRFVLSADPPWAAVPYADPVMKDAARSLLAEPRAPDPPPVGWRDWLLVGALTSASVVEVFVRQDVVWPAVSLLVVPVLAAALLVRRVQPLAAVAAAFAAFALADLASVVAGVEWEGLNAIGFALLLPYALFRWGSGRQAVIGLAIILVPVLIDQVGASPASDLVGGVLIVSFAATLGASVRYQENARLRTAEQVRLRGREQLARELHDTVAHHVSAIAIQAQAGRTLATSRLESALDALDVIEEEAARTLDEMRTIVGALRQGEDPDLAPLPGVADLERLAILADDWPRIDIELSGDLHDLRPSVDTALYRLAQESITNARRHARNATWIRVAVTGDEDRVLLTVSDDGDGRPASAGSPGYGLTGMAERARLQGGTLEAGPDPDRGWTVRAVLPRNGMAR